MRLMILISLLVAFLPLSATAAEPREISGSVVYRERMALPPEAEMLVELRDTAGLVVAQAQLLTGGAQVPLPFSIEGPPDVPLNLRAALRVGSAIRWLAGPVAIEAGQTPVELGEIMLRGHKPMGFATMMTCGELMAELGFVDHVARLRIGGTYLDLAPQPVASGSRFVSTTDPGTWIWTHGDVATLSLDGVEMPECREMLPDGRYTARGNEPGWSVTFENGRMRYVGDYGATEVTVVQPEPRIVDGARRYEAEGLDLAVTLSRELCHDDMSGIPHPDRASVGIGGRELRGCAGDPRDLFSAHAWRVEDIAGGGIIDGSSVTLHFDRQGRIAGRGGCNAYRATYELTGEGLSIGPAAATKMACPEALMAQEQRFFDALAQVSHIDISDNGALRLMAGPDAVLTARR